MNTLMNIVAALTWNQGLEPRPLQHEQEQLRIEGVEYIVPTRGAPQPARIRITGHKADMCLRLGEPAVDIGTGENRIVISLGAEPGLDKPCTGRSARFRIVTPLIGLPDGVYEVHVNEFVAEELLEVRYAK